MPVEQSNIPFLCSLGMLSCSWIANISTGYVNLGLSRSDRHLLYADALMKTGRGQSGESRSLVGRARTEVDWNSRFQRSTLEDVEGELRRCGKP